MAAAAPPEQPHALDTGVERLARVYAQAIIEAADEKNCRAEVIDELESLVREVLPKVPRAREVFDSPRVSVEEKDALIDRIAAGRMQPTTANALHVLVRHGRLGIIAEVTAAARRLAEEMAGRRQAIITTAVSLTDEQQRQIVADIEHAVGVSLAPCFAVDSDLVGGLVVRIGDTVYDQSIATGLGRLGGNLHRRTIHEIQHGRNRLASA